MMVSGRMLPAVTLEQVSMGIQVQPSNSHDSPAARYLHAVIGADNRVRQIKGVRLFWSDAGLTVWRWSWVL